MLHVLNDASMSFKKLRNAILSRRMCLKKRKAAGVHYRGVPTR